MMNALRISSHLMVQKVGNQNHTAWQEWQNILIQLHRGYNPSGSQWHITHALVIKNISAKIFPPEFLLD